MAVEEKPADVELKVHRELAKVGYSPSTVRQCFTALNTIHEFLQYIGQNQYYSDSVNKKVFLLSLDADYAVITTEELLLREKSFIDGIQTALVLKKPVKVDAPKLAQFKKEVEELENMVVDLGANAKKLVVQIREEFTSRESFGPKRS